MPRAPRQCPKPGCDNRITNSRYCETHTTHNWHTSRTQKRGHQHTLWANAVKTRDKTCQLRYSVCTGAADEADHKTNIRAGGARYNPNNGQAACTPCHKIKTQREAQKARKQANARPVTKPVGQHRNG